MTVLVPGLVAALTAVGAVIGIRLRGVDTYERRRRCVAAAARTNDAGSHATLGVQFYEELRPLLARNAIRSSEASSAKTSAHSRWWRR
jgi:hypothetical protein